MNAGRPIWMDKPTKRQMVLLTVLIIAGIGLSLASMLIDNKPLFSGSNIILILLQVGAVGVYTKILSNYQKHNKRPM
jgi:hypothetical protein